MFDDPVPATRAPASDGARAHTQYRAADGKLVPSVTAILGVLAKPQLVGWAHRLGREGIDMDKHLAELAGAGTLAHAMIAAELGGPPASEDHFTPYQQSLAWTAFFHWGAWASKHTIEPIAIEQPVVCERYRYGGTPDLYALLDGVPTLLDWKTSTGIYPDHFMQLAAYKQALEEQGHEVAELRVVQIARNEHGGWQERSVTQARDYLTAFMHCLKLYQLRRRIK
ncbi:MAG TPA: hypothetical protein VF187_07315 [Gemmatimonadales bacterium]